MQQRRVNQDVRISGYECVGFTLLEVLLAITLTIMLMSGVFGFYVTILRARHEGCQATRAMKMNRSILMGIANEIRHTTIVKPGDGIGFRGDRHSMTTVLIGLPEKYAFQELDPMLDELPPAQLDIRRVSYQLLWDEEQEDDEGVKLCHGLWRTEQTTFDPNPTFVIDQEDMEDQEESRMQGPRAEGELIAPEIKFLEFAYFDGANWRDRWHVAEGQTGASSIGALDELKGLDDQAAEMGDEMGNVRVPPEEDELEFSRYDSIEERDREEEYHADRFTIVVPILQADKTLLSSRQYGVSSSLSRQEGVQ